mmetsp:Transcript_37945/g.91996  ORF Transcript_37945/g.91996 Transcript_37945/m.91996 type:complete len:533 (+) Transcript_37945:68-1666(+)|eukprot:CAMPEP_0113609010 /NCGR_PEP_ID=MMETSP0017_2-20120614/4243_1 /TAXON_ID=2856 /ORGANISM="Cylindrotheca closterium" /LENGTH=532 /DNA_ID=CAMNT_0000517759 /DNA_START=44 /DNA_END=1642 /DNA_ORIENTATION=- /assembly_acc=CAM_ASM_000147
MNSTEPGDHLRTPLRRASYVHVSDLTSAYNIDHGLLEQELNRTNSDSKTEITDRRASDTDNQVDPNSVAVDLDVSLATTSQKRLQPPRGGFNLCVLVGNVNVVVDKRRVDGSRVRLAEVEIGDETGTVSLRARDEQIDVLAKVSARTGAVVLRNCTLELFQGRHIRLAITKWGKISVYPDNIASTPPPPSKMNLDRNFSRIDLTIVASEMVDTQPDAYANRQYRFISEATEAGGRPASAKDSGQSISKQHNHSRRNSRDRRHNRGKPNVFGNRSQYNLAESERRMLQPNQLSYRGMHGYSRFPEGFGVSHFPYPLGGQHEVLSPAPAQQLLFQHQYELQQGHFHQQDYAQTQDQNTHAVNQAATAGFILDPSNRGTFVPNTLNPQLLSNDGSSHVVRIGANPETHEMTSPVIPQTSGPMRMMQRRPVSPEEAQRSSIRMNPDAMAFAPASYSQLLPQPFFPTYHLPVSHSTTLPTFGQVPQYVQTSETSFIPQPLQQVPASEVQAQTVSGSKAQQYAPVVPDGNEDNSKKSA